MFKLNPKNVLFFILFGIIVFAGLIFIGDYKEIIQLVSRINFNIISILLLLSFGNYLIRFFKWQFLLNALSIKTKFKDSFAVFFSGLSMAFVPGKLGDTIKSYFLHKKDNVNVRLSLPVIFVERLTDVFGLLILCFLGLSSLFFNPTFLLAIAAIFIFGVIILLHERTFYFMVKIFSKIKFIKKYLTNVNLVHESLKKLLSIKNLFITIIMSTLSWSLEAFSFYFLVHALGIDIPFITLVFIYAFSTLVGALFFLPGGLGVTEGGLVSLLVLAGTQLSIATFSTIIIRLTTLWFGIGLGLVAFYYITRKINH